MFHAGTKTCQQPVLSKLCTSTFAYVTNTETTQNVAFRQRGACRACKTARDPFNGHKYGGFLAPFFGSPADCNWITVSGGDIFYLDQSFQGICSGARDLELWQLDRGVQLCGGGQKCFQGIKTGHKVG